MTKPRCPHCNITASNNTGLAAHMRLKHPAAFYAARKPKIDANQIAHAIVQQATSQPEDGTLGLIKQAYDALIGRRSKIDAELVRVEALKEEMATVEFQLSTLAPLLGLDKSKAAVN